MKTKRILVNRLEYFFGSTFLKLVHRFKVYGRENIPPTGPLVIIANHSSYYDPPIIVASVYPRQVHFMAKAQLFKIPLFRAYISKIGAFPVKRDGLDKKALAIALKIIKDGGAVGIFPEGTRLLKNEDRKTKEVFQGASFLANKTGAKILPIRIIGTENIKPKEKWLPRPAKITAIIGKPLSVNLEKKEDAASFSDKIMEAIYSME